MSRHRDIRNLDYDEEYDEAYDDSVYGHSYDEHEYGCSPTSSQYMYSNNKDNCQFGAFVSSTDKIVEEDDEKDSEPEYKRRDSSNFERPRLSSEDEILLNSVLDEIRNVVGDNFSDARLIETILEHKYDYESSLNAILSNTLPSTSSTSQSNLPRRQQKDFASNPVDRGGNLKPADRGTPSRTLANPKPVFTPQQNHTPYRGNKKKKDVVEELGATALPPYLRNGDAEEEDQEDVVKELTSTPVAPRIITKIRDKHVDIEKLYKETRSKGKELLNLVVVGHVDAGKSTLMGHLLYLQGSVTQRTIHKYEQESKKIGKQSFMYAWVLDDTDTERERGVTVDISQRTFETETKIITLLDAPGHRDFIPSMITGAARADVSVLVVDASTGGFEAGFESGGQTREHAILVKSLGVSQMAVVVNKLDTLDWNKERFEDVKTNLRQFLKTVGFRESDVLYVPCSGLTGENLIKPPTEKNLTSWYKGPTLLEAINKLDVPERVISKSVRMCVGDIARGQGANIIVSGRLETGYTQIADRLMLVPQNEILIVKGVQAESGDTGHAFAGDHVTLNVTGVDVNVMHVGDFLCDPMDIIPQATSIEARIVVFNITTPITRGSEFYFHYKSVVESAKIKLLAILQKTTGQVLKSKPRALLKNSTAVVELSFNRPLCLEVYKDYKELGRFMLRKNDVTVAAGMVTKILNCTDVS